MPIALTAVSIAASLVPCLLVADFITGLVHWAEDTWTVPGKNALLDRFIVSDNIDHHRRPGRIRAGNYWATNRVCIVGSAVAGAMLALLHVHAWQAYVVCLLSSQANHVHLWAHSSDRPRLVRVLQAAGILQSRGHHGRHHTSPYARNFCAFTNYLNPALDGLRFWRGLEWTIERLGGTVQRGNLARGGF